MTTTTQPLEIGTIVRLQPWHNGRRMPARRGVILAPWPGAHQGWLVWFYAKNNGALTPGETIQGFFARELADVVTGDLADLSERQLTAMEKALSRDGQFNALGWTVHGIRTAIRRTRKPGM